MDGLPYKRYAVWHKANELALDVLALAERPPLSKRFWMKDQICSAAMSVSVNIAEGAGRGTNLDFSSFVDRSRGSLFELDVWLTALVRGGELAEAEYSAFLVRIMEVNAMLVGLRNRLRTDAANENRRSQ